MNTDQQQATFTIYHNPRCRKSRAGLDHLTGLTSKVTIVDYIKTGISAGRLKTLLMKLNLPASALVRTQEDLYKTSLKAKVFNEDEWVKILSENPRLIRRPIVEGRYRAVVADPPHEMDSMFKKQ